MMTAGDDGGCAICNQNPPPPPPGSDYCATHPGACGGGGGGGDGQPPIIITVPPNVIPAPFDSQNPYDLLLDQIPFTGSDVCEFAFQNQAQTVCNANYSLTPQPWSYVYLTYDGSIIPFIGLVVDIGGMIVDGATVLLSAGFGVPGVLVSGGLQTTMTLIEVGYNVGMNLSGQYEAVYDYGSNMLDSSTARYNDSQEPVPLAGFASSFISAINNIQVISSGIEVQTYP